MMQATTSPSLPFPAMTCLPGLSHFLIQSQFLMRPHAPIARENSRPLRVRSGMLVADVLATAVGIPGRRA
jgi:hypothetical protein